MKKIKLLLVDDQVLFIESLKTVLETTATDIMVTAVANNGVEALACIEAMPPDVVLLDVRMPVLNGVDTMKKIHVNFPDVKVMMLTTFDDDQYIQEALEYGAVGYMLKDVPPADLIKSIRALEAGTMQMSPHIISKIMNRREGLEYTQAVAKLSQLSERELEVLGCLALGLHNSDIAERMFLSEQTIKNHVSNIYMKTGIHDRRAIVKLAISAGIDRTAEK